MTRVYDNRAELRRTVFASLKRIAPEVSPSELSLTTPLRDQVDLASLDWMNFLAALRECIGFDIPAADYAKLVTLDDLFAYLEQRAPGAPIAQYPADLVREHRLLGGRIVTIRPIRADDAERIRGLIAASSGESRYKRFDKWIETPSNNLVHFLTDIDYDRCLALVCTFGRGSNEEIVGEARYVANPEGSSCEFGLLIEDSWHKTGIAGLLMEALIQGARDRGFAVMEGLVLASNLVMLRFARALGFEVEPVAGDATTLRISRRLALPPAGSTP